MEIARVEASEGCKPFWIGDGDDAFHEPDPVSVLKRMQHPVHVNEGDPRDVGDRRLPDATGEHLAFWAPDRAEPGHDLTEEMGDPAFGIPAGIDEPTLCDAEFDERQPAETSLDNGVGSDQRLQKVERNVFDLAGRQGSDAASRFERKQRTRRAEVARKEQRDDASSPSGFYLVAAGHAAEDEVEAARALSPAKVGTRLDESPLKRKGKQGVKQGVTVHFVVVAASLQPSDQPCTHVHSADAGAAHVALISMRLGAAVVSEPLGSLTVRTPLSMLASMSSALMPRGRSRVRAKAP